MPTQGGGMEIIMLNCIAVGIGGFFGSILRYLVGMVPLKGNAVFPVNTLIINVVGAFVIGVLASVLSKNTSIDPRLMLLMKVGFCGGFTTFSTFINENYLLFSHSATHALIALGYLLASVAAGFLMLYAGHRLAA